LLYSSLVVVDDVSRRNRVDSTREIIYETVYTVDSKAAENLLQADSFVSTVGRDRSLLFSGQLRLDNSAGALHHKTAFI
jgi:hypothetical protein